MPRVQLKIDALRDEIVRLISDDERGIGQAESLREKFRQLQSCFGRTRSQWRLGRIEDDACRTRFDIIKQPRDTVPRKTK